MKAAGDKANSLTWSTSLWQTLPRPGERLLGNTLELFLPDGWPESGADIHWQVHAATGVSHGHAKDLTDLPPNLKPTHVTVWTPPADSLLTHVTLPTRSVSKIAQALPYALEDQILGDPEQLHFAYYRHAGGDLAVAVTARERLQTWLEALRAANVYPTRLCPAILALPLDANTWSVAFTERYLWVRTGNSSGFVSPISVEAPPTVLSTALEETRRQQSAPAQLIVFNSPEDFPVDTWTSSLGIPVVISGQNIWQDGIGSHTSLNLLQGEFAPTGKLGDALKPLRAVAVILGIWLIGVLSFNLWEWWQLNASHRSYQQAMTTLFRQTFPEAKAVLDPVQQMQRNLETLQGQSGEAGPNDLLSLLARVASTLQANPKVSLRTVKYANAKLTLDLSLPDFESLETIKNALNVTGNVNVEVLAANSRASGVEGRLRIHSARDIGVGGR